jgi:hypothetical protein
MKCGLKEEYYRLCSLRSEISIGNLLKKSDTYFQLKEYYISGIDIGKNKVISTTDPGWN